MSAASDAILFYHKNGLDWLADMDYYTMSGYVHITPEYVLLGQRIELGWYIRLAIGKNCFGEFLRLMPYYLPYIGWARVAKNRNGVQWHQTTKLLRKVQKYADIDILPGIGVTNNFVAQN